MGFLLRLFEEYENQHQNIMTKLTMKEGNYKSCENPTNPQMGLLLRSAEAKMRGWDEGERTNHKSLRCISNKSTNVFPKKYTVFLTNIDVC